MAQQQLEQSGIFDKARVLLDKWFHSDSFDALTAELDKFSLQDRSSRLRVLQFFFTTNKRFKLSYILSPPTIHNLERDQFQRGYRGLNYLLDQLAAGKPLNIGRANAQCC